MLHSGSHEAPQPAAGRALFVAAAIGGGWLMVYLAFALEPAHRRTAGLDRLGLTGGLLAATAALGGLAIWGLLLNDLVDHRRDRALRGKLATSPARQASPAFPGGRRLWLGALVGLSAGLLGAAALGGWSLTLGILLAVAIAFYNGMGRFMPAVGIVTLGLLQALGMGLVNPAAGFVWPVLLTYTHVVACGMLRHHWEGRQPRLRGADLWGLMMGWAFWSLAMLLLIQVRQPPVAQAAGLTLPGWIWVGPATAVGIFVLVIGWHGRSPRSLNSGFRGLGVAWLLVYAAAWLASAGLWWPAASVAGLLAAGVSVSNWRRSR